MSTENPHKRGRQHPLALQLSVRRAYIEGCGSLLEIAATHHVPFQTVRVWCHKSKWGAARNRWKNRQLDEPAVTQPASVAPTTQTFPPVEGDRHAHAQVSIGRLEHALTQLDDAIEASVKADDLHKLSTARQRLFEQWRVLSGIPLPGSRRPPKASKPKTLTTDLVPE